MERILGVPVDPVLHIGILTEKVGLTIVPHVKCRVVTLELRHKLYVMKVEEDNDTCAEI